MNREITRFEVETFKLQVQKGVQFEMELFDQFSMSVDSTEVVQTSREFRANYVILWQRNNNCLLFIFFPHNAARNFIFTFDLTLLLRYFTTKKLNCRGTSC